MFLNYKFMVVHLISALLCDCLLISSLPGKALSMFVDIARLAERFQHVFSKPSLVNLI